MSFTTGKKFCYERSPAVVPFGSEINLFSKNLKKALSMIRATIVTGFLFFAASFLLAPSNASAAFAYIESVNGDLSGNNLAPTQLGNATAGSNTVTGSSGSVEADIFTFVVPTGFRLDTIVLTSFSSSSANMFLSIDSGATYEFSIEEINNQINLPDLNLVLGSALIGTSPGVSVGDDILDNLGSSAPLLLGAGFTPPLPAGTYSVYIQETGAFSNYGLSFNVSAVPEPGCLTLFGCLPLSAFLRRRRSCRSA